MRREGRQHGMVRTCKILPDPLNPRPVTRFVNKFDSPATCGLFTTVPSKPTNHSKFTGKCGKPRCTECHMNPAGKSKDKTKGSEKLNPLSSNLVSSNSNYKLVTWRVVDGRHGSNYSGCSATEMLDHLDTIDVDEYDYNGRYNESYYDYMDRISSRAVEIERVANRDDHVLDDDAKEEEEERDSVMSFCDVGMVFDQASGDDSDEGWCFVGET